MPHGDWEPFPTTLKDDLECGFISESALQLAKTLTPEQQERLAAMALTCFESQWSDRLRDLLRGVACLLGREAKNKQAR